MEYNVDANRKLRKRISDDIETIIGLQFSSLKDAIMTYQTGLYKIIDSDSPLCKVYSSLIVSLVYADSYKMFAYKQKNVMNTALELDTFSIIQKIEDFDDLFSEISANPDIFCKMIQATYEFAESSGLAKALMIKTLSDEENEKIKSICPMHEMDIKRYDKQITLTDIVKNMQNQQQFQKNIMCTEFDEGILIQTAGFIRNYYLYNPEQAAKLIMDLAQLDYKITLFVCNKLPNDKDIHNHIEPYKVFTNPELITYFVSKQEFLLDALSNLFDLFINKTYNEVILNPQQIDDQKPDDILKKLLK